MWVRRVGCNMRRIAVGACLLAALLLLPLTVAAQTPADVRIRIRGSAGGDLVDVEGAFRYADAEAVRAKAAGGEPIASAEATRAFLDAEARGCLSGKDL